MVQKFRPRGLFVTQLILAGAFVLLGIVMATSTSPPDVAANVIGVIVIAFGCAVGWVTLTSVALLTPEGITYRYNLRRRTIPWAAVAAFTVVASPNNRLWATVGVELRPFGRDYVRCIMGSRRFVQRVVAEFDSYRAQLDNVTPAG